MTHLTSDELVDAVEGTLDPERHAHVEQCATCRDEAARLTMMLRDSARSRDSRALAAVLGSFVLTRARRDCCGRDAAAWLGAGWLRWHVLLPLGALALLVMALSLAIPREPVALLTVDATPSATDPRNLTTDSTTDLAIDVATVGGPAWACCPRSSGRSTSRTRSEAGIVVQPGDVERAALELTAAEQLELVRLLQEETEIGTL